MSTSTLPQPIADHWSRPWRPSAWHPSLAILCAFVLLTAALNRQFSYVRLGPLYISEVVLLVLLLDAAVLCVAGARRGWLRTPLTVPVVLYLLAGAVSLARGLPEYGYGALKDSALAYYGLTFFAGVVLIRGREDIERVLVALVAGAWIATALVALVLLPAAHEWVTSSFPKRVSTASNLAMEISMVLCVCLGWRVHPKWRAVWVLLSLGQVGLVVVGMVRSAWASLAVVTVFLAMYRPAGREPMLRSALRQLSLRHRAIALAVLVTLAGSLCLGVWSERAQSIRDEWDSMFVQTARNKTSFRNAQWRLAMWTSAFEQFVDSPLIGVPFGQVFIPHRVRDAGYQFSMEEDNEIHMSPLSISLRMGLFGVLSFAWIVAVSVVSLHQWIRRCTHAGLRCLGTGVLACQIMVLAHSLSCVVLEGPYMGMLFWLLLAMGVVLQRQFPASHVVACQREPCSSRTVTPP